MVLMKAEDKQRLEQMRQQCGQERDLQIKQVENGFIIQSVTRFFVDQGQGPVQAGEMSDTTIAVTAYEAGTIAANFMRYGEFWPDELGDDAKAMLDGAHDPIMPELHGRDTIDKTRERILKDVEPFDSPLMEAQGGFSYEHIKKQIREYEENQKDINEADRAEREQKEGDNGTD